jgi:ubiquinone/menaquinone biosynthesis C-methylase UbiE
VTKNIDRHVVHAFGEEWAHFDQAALPAGELNELFQAYFRIFPWSELPPDAEGFDVGCGSGRWAKLVLPRVAKLHCIDASFAALDVARQNLASWKNCEFHLASVDDLPLKDGSMDFGYSLGVLHHVPNTKSAIESCAQKLKKGAPFLVYLYFAFDNKPWWYVCLWKLSDILRKVISRCPFSVRLGTSFLLATFIYWPLARFARYVDALGFDVDSLPLSSYKSHSFYTMRTDAIDRFGTRLEQRFSKRQIEHMMISAGFENVTFSPSRPYWCALAFKT